MDERKVISLYEAARILDARDKLWSLNCSSYPHLKKDEDRKRLYKEISKEAYPDHRKETMTSDQVAQNLARMLSNGR